MWQKLNRIDIYELEKIRVQLINTIQLVSAAPRSYITNAKEEKLDWLFWNSEESSIRSRHFGTKEKVQVLLDMERFVLSIFGKNDHVEHLVLSGMTYPMAYGWMKIKLDAFHLNGQKFNDVTSYTIEKSLISDEEINVKNQPAVHDLTIYYSNAFYLLNQLLEELNIQGQILINPRNLNLELITDISGNPISLGFAPGDKDYLEPYFFLQLQNLNEKILPRLGKTIGIWNTKNWYGLVFLTSEFMTLDPAEEKEKVIEFYKLNIARLFDS